MKYWDLRQDEKQQELLFEEWWLVVLSPREKSKPEANFAIFEAKSGELLFQPAPPLEGSNQYDGFTNFYIKKGKVFVGSWSGYRHEVDFKNMQLINGLFTK